LQFEQRGLMVSLQQVRRRRAQPQARVRAAAVRGQGRLFSHSAQQGSHQWRGA